MVAQIVFQVTVPLLLFHGRDLHIVAVDRPQIAVSLMRHEALAALKIHLHGVAQHIPGVQLAEEMPHIGRNGDQPGVFLFAPAVPVVRPTGPGFIGSKAQQKAQGTLGMKAHAGHKLTEPLSAPIQAAAGKAQAQSHGHKALEGPGQGLIGNILNGVNIDATNSDYVGAIAGKIARYVGYAPPTSPPVAISALLPSAATVNSIPP